MVLDCNIFRANLKVTSNETKIHRMNLVYNKTSGHLFRFNCGLIAASMHSTHVNQTEILIFLILSELFIKEVKFCKYY